MPAVFVEYEIGHSSMVCSLYYKRGAFGFYSILKPEKLTARVVLNWLSGAEKKALLRMNSVFLKADGIFCGLSKGSLIHGVLLML